MSFTKLTFKYLDCTYTRHYMRHELDLHQKLTQL